MSKKEDIDDNTGREFKNTLELIFKYKVGGKMEKDSVNILDLYGKDEITKYLLRSGFGGSEQDLYEMVDGIYNIEQTTGQNLVCLVGLQDGEQVQGKTQWVRVHHLMIKNT